MHLSTHVDQDDELVRVPADVPRATPPQRKVSRTLVNFWLDATLFVAIALVVWLAVLMQVVFPRPTSAEGWELWGLTFNQWRDAQFAALCVATLLALEHVVLHWNWVCSVVATQLLRVKNRPDEGIQALYGVGLFITIVLVVMGSIVVAIFTVKHPQGV